MTVTPLRSASVDVDAKVLAGLREDVDGELEAALPSAEGALEASVRIAQPLVGSVHARPNLLDEGSPVLGLLAVPGVDREVAADLLVVGPCSGAAAPGQPDER